MDEGKKKVKHSEQHLFKEWLAAPPPTKKKTAKQESILQAAMEMFAEKGFDATATSEIAERAGVAEGTIFRHFKSKKELLHAIMVPMMTKLIAPVAINQFVEVLEVRYDSFELFLRAVVSNRLTFVKSHLPALRILLQEIPFQDTLRKQFFTQVQDQVLDKIFAAIVYYQEKGEIRPFPPQTIFRFMVSVFAGYALSRFILFPDQDWEDEQEIESNLSFILQGLAPVLKSEP
jgi:AcrR family transcriptional regulator